MITISVDNVNDALKDGIKLIHSHGVAIPSRNGATLEVPEPVSTVYHRPYEKVLLSKVRDANPFFHLMEAMWILAGRSDVKFLSEFNKRIVNYSDDGVVFNEGGVLNSLRVEGSSLSYMLHLNPDGAAENLSLLTNSLVPPVSVTITGLPKT